MWHIIWAVAWPWTNYFFYKPFALNRGGPDSELLTNYQLIASLKTIVLIILVVNDDASYTLQKVLGWVQTVAHRTSESDLEFLFNAQSALTRQ